VTKLRQGYLAFLSLAFIMPLIGLFIFNSYPAGIGGSRMREIFQLACLAAVTYSVASALAYWLLRYLDVELRRAVKRSGLILAIALFVYIVLLSFFTEVPSGTSRRVPIGFVYSKDFLDLLPSNGGNEVVTKEEFEYNISRIYRRGTLSPAIVLVVGAWMWLFASGGYFCTALLRLQNLQAGLVEMTLQKGGETVASMNTSRGGLERTIRDRIPQLDMAVWRERTTTAEGQVCRIEVDGNAAGTGFLVGPGVVLTNYHVVESLLNQRVLPNRVTARFDYKVHAGNARSSGVVVGLDPTGWNLDFSPYADCDKRGGGTALPTLDELDYALLQLDRAIGLEEFTPGDSLKPRLRGWIALPDQLSVLSDKAPLVIVQHPDGAPLKLAIDTEAFLGLNSNQSRMRYTTNTEPGSSGSPVFDFEWNLVALHHLGDPAVGRLKAEFNQGIPVSAIRRRIVDPSRADASMRTAAISRSL
jgi:hypothetical protein